MKSAPRAFSYIRFSSPEQAKGDSLRRQLEATRQYAEAHGLVLDESLTMRDEGLSAFKGHHKTKGVLGDFLQLVQEGRIPQGSVLIVESLDRLSREKVLDALTQFTDIVRAGITVVTLQDGMSYSQESIDRNFTQLIISIAIMSRAHEESQVKSQRLGAAWGNKKAEARETGKPLTSRCPAWLRISEGGSQYEVIPEAADTIRWIFKMKLQGLGKVQITRKLNEQASWKPSGNGWRESYVHKLFTYRSVIGEYQPMKTVEGKRIPDGEAVKDYYPVIVDNDTFHAVQDSLAKNKGKGGRNGKVSNLFSHVAKCRYCGASMSFVNKGKPPKGGKYLVCENARRGILDEEGNRVCIYHSVPYPKLEAYILKYIKGLSASDVLPQPMETQSQLRELRERVQALAGRRAELEEKISNISEAFSTVKDHRVHERIEKQLVEMYDQLDLVNKEHTETSLQLSTLETQSQSADEQLATIRELRDYLAKHPEDVDTRKRLRSRVQQLVRLISIAPRGRMIRSEDEIEAIIAEAREANPTLGKEEIQQMREDGLKQLRKRGERELTIRIKFHGGSFRDLKPFAKDAPELWAEKDKDAGTLRVREKDEQGNIVEEITEIWGG